MADKDALVITLNGMVPLVAVSDSSDSKSKLRDSIFPNMSMRHEFGAVYDGVNAEDRAGKKESMNESASDGTATTTYGALHTALAVEVPKIASSEQDEEQQNDIGYRDLLTGNREFRLFISSYLVTNCGEWLTYIASIDLIETKLQKSSQESRTAISILVLVRLLPNVIFSAFGGILADRLDKRRLMVVLDVASAISGLFFVLAYELQSIVLVYMATLLQQILSGLYVPSSASIVPMLVRDDKELKKATTLEGLVWSGMQAFGAAASGFIVNALGIRTCFLIDSGTFLASAYLLWLVNGEYNVSKDDSVRMEQHSVTNAWHSIQDGVRYLCSSFFASLVFLKGTCALAYGACDVLNVVLSEQGDERDKDKKLGILFSLVGTGCLLGPLLTEPFVDMERPSTLQLSCVLSFGVGAIGYLGWSFESSFWVISIFALIRSAGSSIIWINSTLLLQKFSSPKMMGRVLATDFAIALLAESLSAYYCGVLLDKEGLSTYQVSFLLAIFSLVLTVVWSVYHLSGHGAIKYQKDDSTDSTESGEQDTDHSSLLKNGEIKYP